MCVPSAGIGLVFVCVCARVHMCMHIHGEVCEHVCMCTPSIGNTSGQNSGQILRHK